eukprot:Gregarina_sp_Pseudo_9__1847@NODE_225_length_3521_cov_97_495405_g209_i0_p2_GENE_NODE_225_length_3521_cov_97_495405_g209_i0NODE_225_length_3521_cov_97_495405_g209_i0_p2_ORF_typecomplete_len435_score153_12Glyco_transf_34/PF05637_12/0_0016_NODE_225_length_3521_cov_97_495405_g209_i05791883
MFAFVYLCVVAFFWTHSGLAQGDTTEAPGDPFQTWLARLQKLTVVALRVPGWETNSTLDADALSAASPLVCDSIVYTAHSLHRPAEEALDHYRVVWAQFQEHTCLFLFLLDLERDETQVSRAVRDAWRRRGSPHDPRILTHRYKAGLYLMALIQTRRLQSRRPGVSPWVLYVDGDTMLANVFKSVSDIVQRVDRGTALPTVETRLCARKRDAGCPAETETARGVDAYALVMSVSNNCHQGYYTHSGTFLFRASRTAGFLFHVLAESPFYEIDAGKFKMGDQGIWDWLLKHTFAMHWPRLRALCAPAMRALTRTACQYSDLLFSRTLALPAETETAPHPLLQAARETWFPAASPPDVRSEPLGVALVCVKWFNTPACPFPLAKDPLHAFQCGDMLWHLYGCKKEEWRRDPLHKLLLSEECEGLTPLSLVPANRRP